MNIEEVRNKYEEQLMRLPNVTGVGIGEMKGKKIIKILVTHKVPEFELKPEEVVPKNIEGYATDVEESGLLWAQ